LEFNDFLNLSGFPYHLDRLVFEIYESNSYHRQECRFPCAEWKAMGLKFGNTNDLNFHESEEATPHLSGISDLARQTGAFLAPCLR
jgi:hypothetical protein